MRAKLSIAAAAGAVVVATATAAFASPNALTAPTPAGPATTSPTAPTPAGPATTSPTAPAPAAPTGSGPTGPATAPNGAAHHGAGYGRPGPARTVALTVADNGRTVRVRRGDRLMVTLAVDLKRNPGPSTWWHLVTASGGALQALPQTLMARRGVTLARYAAVARGTATLSSSRALCPVQPGAPTCHAMQGWQVTVDVH